jgi:hypothetical protein
MFKLATKRGLFATLVALLASVALVTPQAVAVTTPEEYDVDLTWDPAPVAALAGQMDVTVLPGIQADTSSSDVKPAGGITCRMRIAIHFRGTRNLNTGVVSGNWGFNSNIDCNGPMEYIYTQADLLKAGSVWAAAPSDDCDAVRDGICQVVQSAGAGSCGFCNGSWRGSGDFTLEFPAGSVVVDYPRNKCSTPNPSTVICNLKTGRIHL